MAGCALIGVGHKNVAPVIPKNQSEFARVAVMITSESMRSGGTGVILDSKPGISNILTNKHVCQLIQVGGKVITDDGTAYPVNTFRVYKKHDLCLITVLKDLGVNIKVADSAPNVYSTSVVVGHPSLLPTIVTIGHFSQIRTIQLAVGMMPCDGTETGDDEMSCAFFGGKPQLIECQAQVTSSTISPGSSGSGVFNDKGELAGLIFAGHGELGYGMLVPWEYIHDFLTHLNKYPAQTPDPKKQPENFFVSKLNLEDVCKNRNPDGTCKQTWIIANG